MKVSLVSYHIITVVIIARSLYTAQHRNSTLAHQLPYHMYGGSNGEMMIVIIYLISAERMIYT